jgi:hypothetical protein
MIPVNALATVEACLAVDRDLWHAHVARFRGEARKRYDESVADPSSTSAEHWRLFAEVVELDPRDWDGYGFLDRWNENLQGSSGDCSSGCVFFRPLADELGYDWGTCTNPASHRVGKLTFEHQGCPEFTESADDSELTWP